MTPEARGGLTGQRLGEYQLQSLLGAGGMAEVYRALDTALLREVAVKVLPASLAADPGYVERFRNEARSVAALNHPHIVPVYHYGEEHGLLYLVMPVLRESLRDRLDRERRLPVAEAVQLVVQVASGLDAAHALGVVHRDVKPENILLNDEGRAQLTDFGIARELSFLKQTGTMRTLAATGLPVGTPEYMSPEQLRGAAVDQRADIYALGTVLYELVTGTVPFDAETPYEVAALALTAPLTPPSERNLEVWPELEQVILRAMSRDAAERYADARSFAIALRQVVVHHGAVGSGDLPRWAPKTQRLATAIDALATASPAPDGPVTLPIAALAGEELATEHLPAQRGTPALPRPAQPRRRFAFIMALVLVVMLVGLCGGSALAVLNGFTPSSLATYFGPAGLSSTATNRISGTEGGAAGAAGPAGHSGSNGSATATASTSKGGQARNGTPLPGSAATPVPGAPLTPQPGATPTSTSGTSSTPTPSPTATNTPVPAPTLSFSDITLSCVDRHCHTCSGSQTISNVSTTSSPSWSWQSVPSNLTWGSPPTSGTPNGGPMAAGGSTTITVSQSGCQQGQSWSLTAVDALNNYYYFTMTAPR